MEQIWLWIKICVIDYGLRVAVCVCVGMCLTNGLTARQNSQTVECYDFVGFELHHAMPAFFRSILRVSEVFSSAVVCATYVRL